MMPRCPCCGAKMSGASLCPRCYADLGLRLRCQHLAKLWLSLAIQMLNAGRADIAIPAVRRSLSYQQSREARQFRDFLVEHQYRLIYGQMDKQQWLEARTSIIRLQSLTGNNESLKRFLELIEYLSIRSCQPLGLS